MMNNKMSCFVVHFFYHADDLYRHYKHVLCVDETKSVVRCIYTIGAQRYLYTISLENYGIVKSRHEVNLQANTVLMTGGDRYVFGDFSDLSEVHYRIIDLTHNYLSSYNKTNCTNK